MLTKRFKITAAALAIISASSTAHAATATTPLLVSAITLNACLVVATPMVFGAVDLISGTANDATATLTVTCTPGTGYTVGLDNGLNFATGTRNLKSALGPATVPYGLFQDAQRATPWGTTIGTNTVARTAVVLPAALTVYGRVPSNATAVGVDTYLDTVTVTVTY